MGLSLSMSLSHSLELSGEFLSSCLVQSERMLAANPKVLHLLRGRIEQSEVEFQSVLDAVLVSLLPQFKAPCLDFYAGTGKLLKDSVSAARLKAVDAHLCNSLRVLGRIHQHVLEQIWAGGEEHDAEAFEQALAAIGWAG